MNKNGESSKWVFGFWWLAANAFAWGIFFIINILARWVVTWFYQTTLLRRPLYSLLGTIAGILLMVVICWLVWGAIVGTLQRLVLAQRLVQKGKGWILATMIGLLPFTLFLFSYQIYILNPAFSSSHDIISLAQFFTLLKIVEVVSPFWFGLAQWLVLRRTFRRSAWWMVAAVLAVGLVTFSFPWQSLVLLVFRPHHAFLLLAPVGMGLLYAILTWIVLVYLPRRPSAASLTGGVQ